MTDRSNLDLSGWVRLVGEVQQLGLETARAVASRFAGLADRSLGDTNMAAAPVDAAVSAWRTLVDQTMSDQAVEQFTAASQAMTDAFVEMMQAAWTWATESTMQLGAVPRTAATADLGSVAPGSQGTGTAYVHVAHDATPDAVALRVGEMATGSGATLAPGTVTSDPAVIEDPVPGRTYQVKLHVDVPADTERGRYRGYLFARTEPETAVAIELEVAGS